MRIAVCLLVSVLTRAIQASSDELCHTSECVSEMTTYTEGNIAQMQTGSAEDSSIRLLQRMASDDTSEEDPAESCDAFDKKYPNIVKVDFSVSDTSVSNLGGAGPQKGAAEELYYRKAAQASASGEAYDLKVKVLGNAYESKNPKINGQNGHYGVINVRCGTSVDLEFQFIDPKTSQPVELHSFVFSWFDLDKGILGGGDETVVLWPGYTETVVSTGSEIVQSTVSCPNGAGAGECKSFGSSTSGTGKDNPENPLTLTTQQAARTFSTYYKDVSSFRVTLKAGAGAGGRNFLFTGMSEVAYGSVEECCPEHVCGCKSSCTEDDNTPWEKKCSYAQCAMCDECVTTTTTTTAAPVSKEETCRDGIAFDFSNLVENTLGSKSADGPGRLLFKNVAEHEGRSLDITVTDASTDASYRGQDLSPFEPDARDYTGAYKSAGRIAFDKPGKFMFRFRLTDSQTGGFVKLPLFPLTLFDVDGRGELIVACNVAKAILNDPTGLQERYEEPCYQHGSKKKEVNIPQNFDSLTANQKKKTVTYVYRNTGEWDIGVRLSRRENERYFLFGGSKVLACDYEDKTRDKPWKNKGKEGDA